MKLPSSQSVRLPLALQLIGLTIGALLVAQIVTLVLVVLLPPEPILRWDLPRVAAALLQGKSDGALDVTTMAGPPDVSRGGWLVSESSSEALAKAVHRPRAEVVLAFYTQLPVGGVVFPAATGSPRQTRRESLPGVSSLLGIAAAQAQSPPPGLPPGGIPPGGVGGPPGGGPPGGAAPGGRAPGSAPPGGMPPSGRGLGGTGAPPGADSPPQAPSAPAPGPAAGGGSAPSGEPAPRPAGPPAISPGPITGGRPIALQPSPLRSDSLRPALPAADPALGRDRAAPAVSTPVVVQTGPASPSLVRPQGSALAPTAEGTGPAAEVPVNAASAPAAAALPIPFRQTSGLLAWTTPPFIEGDFVAAMRKDNGTWVTAAPRAEPFPNRWQKRVLLWFALSVLLVAPFAWFFARRIVLPLNLFSRAAEALGRDPSAHVLPLSGPAEIGRAARAFNLMQTRLRAFVDDRTAMVGAIGHDLRTPLTRLRFRIEDVPDDLREALLQEVDEMEQLITQVLAFIRDASTPGPREPADLAELVRSTVDDAKLLGDRIELDSPTRVPIEVDPLGIRRLLGNLLENALKYGQNVRVRVRIEGELALAEIIDDGPGIPHEELVSVFKPFFRGIDAKSSDKPGSGLGLAVCRSIARAHGGDVRLERRAEGFVASVVLPRSELGGLRAAA